MKIFISAAEASSDTHAAEALKRLVKKLKSRGVSPEVYGIGGPKLRAAGLRAILPAENFLAMGFVEVVKRIPQITRDLAMLEAWVAREKPAIAVLCDYPEFHFKLAVRLKRHGIRTLCYIPPKIWVWRKGRIRKLEALYDRVLSILPFEAQTYAGSNVNFEYVGNPLVDELPLDLSRKNARDSLGLSTSPGTESLRKSETTLLLMVGSRPSEFKFHLKPMLEAAIQMKAALGPEPFSVLLPIPETTDLEAFKARLAPVLAELPGGPELSLRVSQGDAWIAMKASDVAIVKSGTSSLEAALLGCPHLVVYHAHPFSEFLFKYLVRYRKSISLTNLILGRKERIVCELILENFTSEKMAAEAVRLLRDPEAISQMRSAFSEIRDVLGKAGPSDRVADIILEDVLRVAQ